MNSTKILAEPGSTPLSKNTVKQMLKYLQRFPSVDKNRKSNKAFEEDVLDLISWIRKLKEILT